LIILPELTKPQNADQSCYWPSGNASALALSVAGNLDNNPFLIVASNAHMAQELTTAFRFFVGNSHDVINFPDYETLAYDFFSPGEDLISDRLQTLFRLGSHTQTDKPFICIVSVSTLMQRLTPKTFVVGGSLSLAVGDRFDMETRRRQLADAGYRYAETVTEHGQFAIRGSLMDVFPMGQELPLRIDLFDDEVETIRCFDPDTQLTVEKIQRVEILPGREFGLTREDINRFKNNWHTRFDGDPEQSQVYQTVSKGFSPQGVESYLPLFHEKMASLLEYLPSDLTIVSAPDTASSAELYWREVSARHEQFSGNLDRPLLKPAELFIPAGELLGEVKKYRRIDWGKLDEPVFDTLPDISLKHQAETPSQGFQNHLNKVQHCLLVAESAGRREVLNELLGRDGIQAPYTDSWEAFCRSGEKIGLAVAPLEQGFYTTSGNLSVITETELLSEKVRQPRSSRNKQQSWADSDQIIRNLTELRIGAPVVHIEHGVGRYRGLETLKVNGQTNEFLYLEYAGDNKLYVPVTSLNLISRYTGADVDTAPLNKLGSDQWEKAKKKAREQIRDTAAELLDIYARRMAKPGHSFQYSDQDYQHFCDEFPFEETEDQQTTMAAVEADMAADRAMDRLVCGDVGFGKTEIAMRAAYIAATSGKQVLMLVPTTLLARQHYDSFRDRFANWPVRIDSVSRLKSAADQENVLSQFGEGKIDILIGTHKLLTDSVKTEKLGLLIVDEEHRFGVRQKEKLKSLKAEVDILTLTATPIPRTLNMAMASVRDLSIIATPPAKRLAVKTFVRNYEKAIVKEAIQREMLRGGQIYYLHNEVRSIERAAEELRELMPECRIGVAHGQMRERNLESIISDFYHHRFDVLVCSTIIETGIDIPNANTIIIDRADKFGLAQLHQLRGRVGRSHHQAYAYLLTPDIRSLTADAEKRLEAIQAADHLGSGFTLATHDLEIRGAGELLGDNQSGQIHAIGFELYQQMLEKAVKALQSGKKSADIDIADHSVEINLNASALIPDDYLPDVNGRLQLYKRIAATESEDQLRELQVEMIDRFGLLPEQVKLLIRQQRLRQQAEKLGIRKIDCGDKGGKLHFEKEPSIDPMKLIEMVQKQPGVYRFDGQTGFRFSVTTDNAEQRFEFVEKLVRELG
jgi:transcription-repair coupling factor (superfamily II helicase)